MTLKKAYHYLFYKFYKSLKSIPGNFWEAWKAIVMIDALLLFVIATPYFYYLTWFDPPIHKLNNKILIPILLPLILIPNYYIFDYKDKWKKYVKEFDKWPKKKQAIGGFIVWTIVILLVANYFYSMYLYQHSPYFYKMKLYNNDFPVK